MSFEEFQDGHPGGNFGYRNGMILAILNLCVMPPIEYWTTRPLINLPPHPPDQLGPKQTRPLILVNDFNLNIL